MYMCIKKVQNWNEGNFPLAAVDFELVPQPSKVKRKYPIFINSLSSDTINNVASKGKFVPSEFPNILSLLIRTGKVFFFSQKVNK